MYIYSMPITAWAGRRIQVYQRLMMKKKDARMSVVNEVLQVRGGPERERERERGEAAAAMPAQPANDRSVGIPNIRTPAQGIRIIKMFAWEQDFLRRIETAREAEVSDLKWLTYTRAVLTIVWVRCPPSACASALSPR